MTLWKHTPTLDQLNASNAGTLAEATGMEFTAVGADFLRMRMPVDERTKQPMGRLHGGASAALAETIGSVASTLCLDSGKGVPVGIELNCSHLRGVSKGHVYAECRAVRVGRSVHVWDVRLTDDRGKLTCVCRLTVSIIPLGLVGDSQ